MATAAHKHTPVDGVLLSTVDMGEQILSLAPLFERRQLLPLDQWAERYITLSSKYSARTSKLKLYGWQRGIFAAYTEEGVNEITIACSTQLTKTLLLQAALAYSIVEEPGPLLVVQPKEEDAKAFSKERLDPMIEDCDILKGRISASSKDGNTILQKDFPGGFVAMVGAIAPGNLARRPIKCVFFDEIDKYPMSSGKEGDPLVLGKERTVTFGKKAKVVKACSPTDQTSRIWASYKESDQRKPYVPCPSCGTMQVLSFRNGVKWDSKLPRSEQPASAHYLCSNKSCGAKWNDFERWRACEMAEWRAHAPFRGHAGFWINHLYSPHKTLSTIVDDFLKAQNDRNTLKAFINTTLAEIWEEAGSTPDAELLYSRREDYPHSEEAVVPRRALFLTAAVDVQDNRLEVEVVGWGRYRERWSVGYFVIQEQLDGEFLPSSHPRLWEKLDQEILQRAWPHEKGRQMPILCMGIDTGYRPKPVYDFCARHAKLAVGPAGAKVILPRTVVAVKGTNEILKLISVISKEDAARKRQNVRIVSIGTYAAKQEIFDILNNVRPRADGKPTPQCYHFPDYNLDYFNMLSSEIRVVHEDGEIEYVKKQNQRNEALDVAVYNRAAAALIGIDRFTEDHWQQMEEQLGITKADREAEYAEMEEMKEKLKVSGTSGAVLVGNAQENGDSVTISSVSKTSQGPSSRVTNSSSTSSNPTLLQDESSRLSPPPFLRRKPRWSF